jgi:AcrR family transcriptional regulator
MKADLRTTDTKERVIAEARRLYQLGGYSHLSLDAIAKALNITRPALYFHFPGGKDQLLVEVLKSWNEEAMRQLEGVLQENQDARSRLREIMVGVVNHPLPDSKEIIMAHIAQLSEAYQKELFQVMVQLNRIVTNVIKEGIRKGELREVDPNIAFFSFMALCHQVEKYPALCQQMPQEFASQFPESVEETIDKLLDLWFCGIVAPTRM